MLILVFMHAIHAMEKGLGHQDDGFFQGDQSLKPSGWDQRAAFPDVGKGGAQGSYALRDLMEVAEVDPLIDDNFLQACETGQFAA